MDGQEINDQKLMAEKFNEFFSSVGSSVSKNVNPTSACPLSFLEEKPNIPDLDLGQTGPVHFCDILKNFESKASQDLDGISIKLLKAVRHAISVPLSHIFNMSLETGIFPEKFKTSRIVPIFKCGDTKNVDNYRPIALVSTLSKILEKMVAIQLTNHLDINGLIYKHQYGFHKQKSTEHHLIHLTNYIGQALKGTVSREKLLNCCLGAIVWTLTIGRT